MGFRFRKSIGFGPFRINFSRRGAGVSVGVPGARVTNSATGRKYLTLGIPGTGISWTRTIGSRRSISNADKQIKSTPSDQLLKSENALHLNSSEESRPLAPLEFE